MGCFIIGLLRGGTHHCFFFFFLFFLLLLRWKNNNLDQRLGPGARWGFNWDRVSESHKQRVMSDEAPPGSVCLMKTGACCSINSEHNKRGSRLSGRFSIGESIPYFPEASAPLSLSTLMKEEKKKSGSQESGSGDS